MKAVPWHPHRLQKQVSPQKGMTATSPQHKGFCMVGFDKHIKFYSQNGEDYLLWHFFAQKPSGFFVDIGAFDGIHLSNSYAFERMGWQGICVEPNPEVFVHLRKNRPASVCLNRACIGDYARRTRLGSVKKRGSDKPGRVDLFVDEMGLLATTVNDNEKFGDIEKRYEKRGLPFRGLKKVEVPACTFRDIISQGPVPEGREIDFVSIDTEGNEQDIVCSIDFDRYNIRVLVVEYDKGHEEGISGLLFDKGGYVCARKTPHNLIFVKNEGDLRRMKEIVVDCVIEKQVHPKGRRFTIPIFLKGKTIRE